MAAGPVVGMATGVDAAMTDGVGDTGEMVDMATGEAGAGRLPGAPR